MKLLVHACCGPCSIMPTRLLAQAGHDITVFYANSNIAPQAEYARRLAELQRFAAGEGFRVVEGAYDPAAWERDVAPVGEAIKRYSPAFGAAASAAVGSVADLLDDERRKERCRACYRMRLEESARVAAEGGYDGLATTLAVSPYQFTDVIREETHRAAGMFGIAAHFQDYRPYYAEATRISRELGMYRQNYCGCRFSVQEGEATRAFVKAQRARDKAAKAADRAAREAAAEPLRASRSAERQAYADERARRKAVLKQLRRQRES